MANVDIPNVGVVEFPDTMSEDAISAAAKRLYTQRQGQIRRRQGIAAAGAQEQANADAMSAQAWKELIGTGAGTAASMLVPGGPAIEGGMAIPQLLAALGARAGLGALGGAVGGGTTAGISGAPVLPAAARGAAFGAAFAPAAALAGPAAQAVAPVVQRVAGSAGRVVGAGLKAGVKQRLGGTATLAELMMHRTPMVGPAMMALPVIGAMRRALLAEMRSIPKISYEPPPIVATDTAIEGIEKLGAGVRQTESSATRSTTAPRPSPTPYPETIQRRSPLWKNFPAPTPAPASEPIPTTLQLVPKPKFKPRGASNPELARRATAQAAARSRRAIQAAEQPKGPVTSGDDLEDTLRRSIEAIRKAKGKQ